MTKKQKDYIVSHPPEYLLESAELLLSMDNPKTLRAAVLEAVTALESFVHEKVFTNLKRNLDAEFVSWLDDKTRMDFDARLSILVPFATGLTISTDSKLWADYKKARSLRHKVAHSSVIISSSDAAFVIDTVFEWLCYLGNDYITEKRMKLTRNADTKTQAISATFLETSARLERLLYGILRQITVNEQQPHDREIAFLVLEQVGILDGPSISDLQRYRRIRSYYAHDSREDPVISDSDRRHFSKLVDELESDLGTRPLPTAISLSTNGIERLAEIWAMGRAT